MVPQLPAARSLQTLPARPPTPPKESSRDEDRAGHSDASEESVIPTPPHSTPEPDPSVEKPRKKVGWSMTVDYSDAPARSSPRNALPVSSPASNHRSADAKPTKSILKSSSEYISSGNFSIAMLEPFIQQLASDDRSSRIDAYTNMSGALRASEDTPQLRGLKDKMGPITKAIQRDMSAKLPSGDHDTALVNSCLLLLADLLSKPPLPEFMSNDFCGHVVENAITALKTPKTPKESVKYLIFVMGNQHFSPRVLTNDRINRLLDAMNEVDNHVQGKSIDQVRITAYRTLLKSSKQCFMENTIWVEDLLSTMIDPFEEVRNLAIEFGFEAALSLGTTAQPSRTLMEIFSREHKDGKFANYYVKKLRAMLKNNQGGVHVPRIWSVIILFLRAKPQQVLQWRHTKLWLDVVQACFNSKENLVKAQANIAWNHLVFAVNINEKTASSFLKMVSQPLVCQLRGVRLEEKHAKEVQQSAVGSTCNLLYYALRPSATSSQLDIFWDDYVVKIIDTLVSTSQKINRGVIENDHLVLAMNILKRLFDTKTPKVWKETRATEKEQVRADELPTIDCKWIRKSAPRVFAALRPIFLRSFQSLAEEGRHGTELWDILLDAIAFAGSKEIKVSMDTMTFVASMFNMVYVIWGKASRHAWTDEDSGIFIAAFQRLVSSAISKLGVLPFTEKLLSITQNDDFTVVATPSHRPSVAKGTCKTPLHHLVTLLCRPPGGPAASEAYTHMVVIILGPFFENRESLQSRLDLANDLLSLLETTETPAPDAIAAVYQAIVSLSNCSMLKKADSARTGSSSQDPPVGTQYQSVVKILEYGVSHRITSPSGLNCWKELLMTVATQASIYAGDSGRAISVIEPVATFMEKASVEDCNLTASYCSSIISLVVFPRDSQAVDAAYRRVWGATLVKRASNGDPYNNLYDYISDTLVRTYKCFGSVEQNVVTNLLIGVSQFLDRCPNPATHIIVLSKIRLGLSIWLEDEARILKPPFVEPTKALGNLWNAISAIIRRQGKFDTSLVEMLEPILCSALSSPHKSIATSALTLWNKNWNDTPSAEKKVKIPSGLRKVLRGLKSVADLELPADSNASTENGDLNLESQFEPSFMESQEDVLGAFLEEREASTKPNKKIARSGVRSKSPSSSASNGSRSRGRGRPRKGTPVGSVKAPKKVTTPKLRHDDSQVQFAAIRSSPMSSRAVDEELLTDRQKEIRERQKAKTAAMFPDIRSSPRPPKSSMTKFNLTQTAPNPTSTENQDPATPTLPNGQAEEDDYFGGSSPTPRGGSGFDKTDDVEMVEYPSSPPGVPRQGGDITPEDAEVTGASIPLQDQLQVTHQRENTVAMENANIYGRPQQKHQPPYVAPISTAETESEMSIAVPNALRVEKSSDDHLEASDKSGQEHDEAEVQKQVQSQLDDQSPKITNDEFVDAPMSPQPPSSAVGSVESFVNSTIPPSSNAPLHPPVQHGPLQIAPPSQFYSTMGSSASLPTDPLPRDPVPTARTAPVASNSFGAGDMDETSMLRVVAQFDKPPSPEFPKSAPPYLYSTDELNESQSNEYHQDHQPDTHQDNMDETTMLIDDSTVIDIPRVEQKSASQPKEKTIPFEPDLEEQTRMSFDDSVVMDSPRISRQTASRQHGVPPVSSQGQQEDTTLLNNTSVVLETPRISPRQAVSQPQEDSRASRFSPDKEAAELDVSNSFDTSRLPSYQSEKKARRSTTSRSSSASPQKAVSLAPSLERLRSWLPWTSSSSTASNKRKHVEVEELLDDIPDSQPDPPATVSDEPPAKKLHSGPSQFFNGANDDYEQSSQGSVDLDAPPPATAPRAPSPELEGTGRKRRAETRMMKRQKPLKEVLRKVPYTTSEEKDETEEQERLRAEIRKGKSRSPTRPIPDSKFDIGVAAKGEKEKDVFESGVLGPLQQAMKTLQSLQLTPEQVAALQAVSWEFSGGIHEAVKKAQRQ